MTNLPNASCHTRTRRRFGRPGHRGDDRVIEGRRVPLDERGAERREPTLVVEMPRVLPVVGFVRGLEDGDDEGPSHQQAGRHP